MKKNSTINCDQAIARFNDFMDNFLKEGSRNELMKHLSECSHCMEKFEFEQMLKSKVHQLYKDGNSEAFIKRVENLIASLS